MASTYSTNLAIELIGTGEQAGTWGVTTNSNLGTLIEQAISGYVTQAVATGTDTTITIPNGATGVARNMYIELTGTGGTNTNLIVPANKKLYFIFNNSTGAVTVKVAAQTGVSVAAGEKKILVSNGTDIVEATSYISANATSASIVNLNVTSANITTLTSASGTITNLLATNASFGSASLSNADILSAVIGSATITGAGITSAAITTVTGTTLGYGSASLSNLKAVSAVITSATVTGLGVTSAAITTLTGTTASYGSASLTNLNVSSSATLARFSAGSSAVSNLLASGAITAVGNISTSGNLSASGSITASSGSITQLTSTSATITTLKATSATIDNVSFTSIVLTNATITSANITTLTGTTLGYASASITTVTGTTIGAALSSTILGISGAITTLTGTSADITTITGLTIGTTASSTIRGVSGVVGQFNSTSATITTLTGTTAGYGSASLTNLKAVSAVITSASITGLGVTSAAITTLTGTTLGYASASITTVTGATIGTTASATIRGVSGVIGQFNSTSATITTLSGSTLGYGSASLANLGAVSAVITSATVTNLGSTSAAITTLSNTTLNSGSASITVLTGGNVTFTSGTITNLVTTSITLSTVNFTSATIVNLNSTSAVITTLNGTSANITTITGTTIGTTASATILGVSGQIGQLTSTSATITTLTGTTVGYGSASLTNMKAVSAVITSATITGLGVTSAAITTLTGTTLGYASASITTVTGATIGTTASATIRGVSGVIAQFNATSATITTLTSTSATITGLSSTSAALGKFTAGSSAVSNFLASGTITALGNISTSGNLSASGSITGSSGVITQFTATSATITTLTGTTVGYGSASLTNMKAVSAVITSATVTGVSITSAAIGKFTAGSSAVGNLFASGTIQTSGNVGVGVAPATWFSTYKALQVGSYTSLFNDGGSTSRLSNNAIVNAAGNFQYLNNGLASQYQQGTGAHSWYTAASGTAGGTISFTQAMTLDASGNLLVGTTSASAWSTAGRGLVEVNGSSTALIGLKTGDTQRGYVYSQGTDLIVQAVTGVLSLNGTGGSGASVDSSGNLGLGVTPSAGLATANYRLFEIGLDGGGSVYSGSNQTLFGTNIAWAGSTPKFKVTGYAPTLYNQQNGAHSWSTSAAGTAGNTITFSEAMTLNANRQLSVKGTAIAVGEGLSTEAISVAVGESRTGSGFAFIDLIGDTTYSDYGLRIIRDNGGANTTGGIYHRGTGNFYINALEAAALTFLTSDAERARITSGGNLLVGTTTNTNNFRCNFQFDGSSTNGLMIRNNAASGTPSIFFIYDSAQSLNNTGSSASYEDNAALRWALYKNGGLANYQANDVNLSDQRVKKDIKPLGSMWDKFKAIEIVTFKYNDQTHDDDNIGVIAQQVESVAPEFIDVDGFGETPEDGVPLKTVYTTDMYHAAIKALQEAMARIEKLEAEVAALKGA